MDNFMQKFQVVAKKMTNNTRDTFPVTSTTYLQNIKHL